MTDRVIPEDITTAKQQWVEQVLQPALQKIPQQQSTYTTLSGLPVDALYTPADGGESSYGDALGFPGQFPYTRGVRSTMYRGRLWTTRIFSGFGSAEETNKRYKYLLEQGNAGLSVAFDLPLCMAMMLTIRGGWRGRQMWCRCQFLGDMERLFQGYFRSS